MIYIWCIKQQNAMGTYTIHQPMPDRPTTPPEQEYYITRRILFDAGMTCTMCGNPTRNEEEQCDRCIRAIAKAQGHCVECDAAEVSHPDDRCKMCKMDEDLYRADLTND